MQRSCEQCSGSFEITKSDLEFLTQVSPVFSGKKELIPPPTLCPPCREQHRMSFRNEWSFYHRECDLTGKKILSIYSPDKPYKVYEQSVWWSDKFDPLSYGREFDFSRPFFEQWQDLSLAVPRASIHNANSENCEYTNYSGENKNCYLVAGTLNCEDALYSYRISHCSNISDSYDAFDCELCYEVSYSKTLYNCRHCTQCHLSGGLTLCADCNGCQDCFGCVNLRNKKYHIFNEAFEKEEYEKKVRLLLSNMPDAVSQYESFRKTQPHRAVDAVNCEASSGDHLLNCKNCHDVFSHRDSEDCRYGAFCEGNRFCMDANFSNVGELQFNSTNLVKNYHVLFANFAWYDKNAIYVTSCFNSSDIFGCVGMKKHSYCILNKQYTKEEYEELVPKIIDHMRKTGEWGNYFPPKFSPFGFNETAANVEHPLDRETVLHRGWKWHEETKTSQQKSDKAYEIPSDITDVSDDITSQVLTCEVTGKSYKIVPQELKFYRQMGLPIPRKCPDQRYRERVALRNPHKLWKRPCMHCSKEMETTYAPDRPEIVYCEECYLKEVY